MNERTDAMEKFCSTYGSAVEHGEQGEERFSAEYDKADESVWYDLYAFSKPSHFLARLAYPLSRYLQKQFAAESNQAMVKAVRK